MRLEEKVSLEGGHALVHRRELVVFSRAERRALRRVVGVEREERRDFLARRSGEVKIAHIVGELLVGTAVVE